MPTAITEPTAIDATSNATTVRADNTRDLSRVQCYNYQLFGHYARSCPSEGDDPLNATTTTPRNYYQPKWYEVGLDTLSQINILNSRFLTDFVPGDSSFKGLGNQSRSTSYFGTLPMIPGLQCSVCDDCAALILSFALVKKAGVKISYNEAEERFVVHSRLGDIEFYQRGDLYVTGRLPGLCDGSGLKCDDNPRARSSIRQNYCQASPRSREFCEECGLFN